MISITIDQQQIEIQENATVLDAATMLNIHIPTLCHKQGMHNHPSCMVCMVKELKTGQLIPSCAYPVRDSMEISTTAPEAIQSRKTALEMLVGNHIGDCNAPCQTACPAGMNIPLMNRLIAEGKQEDALAVVHYEIALPLVLGYICQAPCENACRRKTIDEAIAICELKKFAGFGELLPQKESANNKKVAIIGSGVAGLTAAFHLSLMGYNCTIFEKADAAGGKLLNEIQKGFLPAEALKKEIDKLSRLGVEFTLNSTIENKELLKLEQEFNAVLICTGTPIGFDLPLNDKKDGIATDSNFGITNRPKLFATGAAIKTFKMAVQTLAYAKDAAFALDKTLSEENRRKADWKFSSRFGKLTSDDFPAYLMEASEKCERVKLVKSDKIGESDAIKEAARCLHCDCRKPDNCKLRIVASEMEISQKACTPGVRPMVSKQWLGSKAVFEPEKCIGCGICVELSETHQQMSGFAFFGRGYLGKPKVSFKPEENESWNAFIQLCANSCPTAAIALK